MESGWSLDLLAFCQADPSLANLSSLKELMRQKKLNWDNQAVNKVLSELGEA